MEKKYVMERLRDKSHLEGDCYIWDGSIVGKSTKYGHIRFEDKVVRIGRLICHLYHGADLNDNTWTANHKPECKSSLCWNPEHLYVGTQYQNVQDQIASGRFYYNTENLLSWKPKEEE